MITGPSCEVVQRFLGSDRLAIRAQHEHLSRRITLLAYDGVVIPGQHDLAGGRDRNDYLYRGVVLGGRIDQLLYAVQQLSGSHPLEVTGSPVTDDPPILRMGVVAPARDADPGKQRAKGPRALQHESRHPGTAVKVVGVSVDRRQPDVIIPDHGLAYELFKEALDGPSHR